MSNVLSERFETERLILRVLEEPDIYELLDYYKRNRKFLEPCVPAFGKDFFTLEFQMRRIKYEKELREKGTEYRYFIFKKDETGKNIGNVAVSNIIRGILQSAFLGYSIDEKENGKGFATEAIRKIIEISFNVIKLHRLEANVIPSSTASIRVLEKLNFVKEGFSKQYLKINGKWEDHIRFAILNNKFE